MPTTWPQIFEGLVNSASVRWQQVANLSAVGRSVVVEQGLIDAQLAALPATPAPEFLIINLGTNDVNGDSNDIYFNNPGMDGAPWISNYQYIIDAVHTKWASCQVYLSRPWKPDYLGSFQAKLDVIGDTLIPSVISGRAWAHLGPDERVYLENGDNGATYITPPPDGLHPNSAGYAQTAQQNKTTVGL